MGAAGHRSTGAKALAAVAMLLLALLALAAFSQRAEAQDPPSGEAPPEAGTDEAEMDEDGEPVIVDVLANDGDRDGGSRIDPASLTVGANPSDGTATANADGTITYTPDRDFFGLDTFTYNVCNTGSALLCATGTVRVTVNAVDDPPRAQNDEVDAYEDYPLRRSAPALLVNDSTGAYNEGSQTPELVELKNAVDGTVRLGEDNFYTFTPAKDFNGVASFDYVMTDGGAAGNTDTATVLVRVAPDPDPPAANDDAAGVEEDGSTTVDVLSNDLDPDGDLDASSLKIARQAANGTATVAANGGVGYAPDEGFSGSDSFAYEVCDAAGACDTAEVRMTVNAANTAPVANDDAASVDEDGTVRIDVLSNDLDPDGNAQLDRANVRVGGPPVEGGPQTGLPQHGSATPNADGTVTYAPDKDFNGTDEFLYTACDASACDYGKAVVTVASVEDAPDAVDDTYRLPENDTIYRSGTDGVLRNDRDGDGDAMTATLVDAPANGTLYFQPGGGFTYVAKPDFKGMDTFTYEASDSKGNKDKATVSMNVEPDTTPPSMDFHSPVEGARLVGDVGFSASASDNVYMNRVQFLVDGNIVAEDVGGDRSYEGTWNSRTVADGAHTVSARAYDDADNPTVVTRNVVVDNANPESSVTGGPAEGSFVNSASASFALTSTEAGGTFECSLDNGKARPCDASLSLSGLSEGNHTLKVWAIGTAGRANDLEAEPTVRTWAVDTVVPTGTVKINKGAATTRKLAVTLNLAAADPAPASGVSQMRFSNDGRTWSAPKPYAATSKWTLKKGKAGMRTVFVQFSDGANNRSAVAKDSIRYKP